MSGVLGLFGIGVRANSGVVPSTSPRIQSSIQGRPKAVGAGQNRVAGNIIWYDDYTAIPQTEGGKGAGATGKGTVTGYDYSASFIVAIGEPIDPTAGVQTLINGDQFDFLETPSAEVLAALEEIGIVPTYGDTYGATILDGAYTQTAWSYLVSAHPDWALAYRGDSLACFANLALGVSSALPNFNFEVRWLRNSDIPALGPDANPADWVEDVLSQEDWGAGFPAVLVGDLDEYRTWARATGMLVSPVLDSQAAAQSHLADLMQGTIAEFCWRGGVLEVVPYADAAVTGNGYTAPANITPVYDLSTAQSDFLPDTRAPGNEETPIVVVRKDPATVINQVVLQYLDRNNVYNPALIYDSNDALIVAAGRVRASDTRAYGFFCLADAASMSASLQMRREMVLATYLFTLPPQFILIDVMDVVTLSDQYLRLVRQAVRVKEIVENEDGSLSFTAEEVLGEVGPPIFRRQRPLGAARNANQDPGDINAPVIFEPTEALAGGLEVWIAVSGLDLSIWGGCNVWVCSEADGTYQRVGTVTGSARMGVTTDVLPTIAEAPSGQTIDSTNTLEVDLSESGGELTSGSVTDMTALNTRCYVGGEIIAYQDATLTAPNEYALEPMVRGAYGSTIGAHPAGEDFVRLDDQLVRYPFTADRVGGTLYVKFQSFNVYGGGQQGLEDVAPVAYQIQGTALSTPLEDVTELRWSYQDKTSTITWLEVDDFREPRYEVRLGASWDAGIVLGVVAHPPFTTYGDGTYWVKPRAEPAPGLIVYSENAPSVSISGSVIPDYELATWDEAALGWPGAITGPGAIDGANFVTTAAGTVAYYTPPYAHVFSTDYDKATRILSTYQVAGVPANDDILSEPDFLGIVDLLGAANTAFVDAWVEINIGTADPNDVYSATDVYALPDVYSGGTGEWQRWAPGQYLGKFFMMRLAIISYDDQTIATASAFTNTAYLEPRVDHWTNYALGAPGETFSFTPDGLASPQPFKGGPNGATVPQVFVAIQNQIAGDYYTVTGVTLSQMTVRCFNAGVGVARTVNIAVEGW